jgi:hypothetical protein
VAGYFAIEIQCDSASKFDPGQTTPVPLKFIYVYHLISVGDRLSMLTPSHVSDNIESTDNFVLQPGSNLGAD